MYNTIVKNCGCGYSEKVELTDELKDEIDMDGYANVYCSKCGDDLDVNSGDLEDSSLYEEDEFDIYAYNDDEDYDDEDYDDDPDYNDRDDY